MRIVQPLPNFKHRVVELKSDKLSELESLIEKYEQIGFTVRDNISQEDHLFVAIVSQEAVA